MRIRKKDKWKTIFRTKYGYFKYQIIPLNLSNIPINFQGYINKILAKKLDIFVIIYLDNILIFIDKTEHVEFIWWIVNQLRKHLLYAN